MLRQMRSSFKRLSWTLWLVILSFIGGFVMIDVFRSQRSIKTGLVFINDELVIREDDYKQQLMLRLTRYKDQLKDFNKSMITQMRIPEQILQNMIDTFIIRTEVEKLNITVSEQEIIDKIINNPGFQRDGKFIGTANYRRLLRDNKIDVTEFESQLKDAVIREKFQEFVTGPLVIDDFSLRERYKEEKDTAELEYISFKPDRIKSDVNVEDKEIANYYEKHKEDFKTAEKRSGYVIAYKFDDYKKEAGLTDQEMYDYFRQNMADFVVPGKTRVSRIFLKYEEKTRDEVFKKIEALRKELTKENFAAKAKEFSQDLKAIDGGDFGYTEWKSFTSQERTIIESLGENEISSPIDTLEGFSLVYIPELIPQKEPVFDEAKEKIRGVLEKERVNRVVMEKLQNIYNKLGKAENIKAKAKEMGVNVIETELMNNGQPVKGVDDMGYISRRLFMLKEKETAFPVNFIKGLAIVQAAKIENPEVQPLEEVKDRVKDKVVTAKKIDLLKEQAAAISEELNKKTDPKNIDEYLKENNLKTEPLSYKRGNRFSYFPVRKGTDDLVFSMELNRFASPLVFEEQGQVVIFKVKEKTIIQDSDFQKDKLQFYEQKINELRNTYFASYLTNKKESFQITMNQEMFDKMKREALSRFN